MQNALGFATTAVAQQETDDTQTEEAD